MLTAVYHLLLRNKKHRTTTHLVPEPLRKEVTNSNGPVNQLMTYEFRAVIAL